MPNIPLAQRVQKAVEEIVVNPVRKNVKALLKMPAPINRLIRRADGTRISDWMHAPAKNVRGKPRPASSYRCARRNEARRSYRAKGRVA